VTCPGPRDGVRYTARIGAPPDHAENPSRRLFVKRAAIGAIAPVVINSLAGCKRCAPEPDAAPEATAPEPDSAAEARPALPGREPVVRVRVLRVRKPEVSLTIDAAGGWIQLGSGSETGDAPPPVVFKAPMHISIGANGWSVLDRHGFRPSRSTLDALHVSSLSPAGQGLLTLDENLYHGTLHITARQDQGPLCFDVVNHVPMEQYLPGVLAGELFEHWSHETHAAQAIAARSFATCEGDYFRGRRHYDVTNTSLSQVYLGATQARRARDAVAATHGRVLTWADRMVPGYYSSCCGGLAADAVDAIGEHPFNTPPPLRGRSGHDVCTTAPLYTWELQRSAADALTRIRAWAETVKREDLLAIRAINGIRVHEHNAHGRPRSFALRDTRGDSVIVHAEALRRALDYPISGKSPKRVLRSAFFSADAGGSTVRFAGHGHGHGAGLCQYGAQALAREGSTFDAILSWYYPQVQIQRAY